jgi:hypothetical protein
MKRRDIDRLVNEEVARRSIPAPYVDVVLRGECSGRRCPTVRGRAKLDTGAAHTHFAPSAVRKLKLRKLGHAVVRGFGGDGRRTARYAGKVAVAGLPSVDLLADGVRSYPTLDKRGDVALIGRDTMGGGDKRDVPLHLEFDAARGEVRVRPAKRTRKRRKK